MMTLLRRTALTLAIVGAAFIAMPATTTAEMADQPRAAQPTPREAPEHADREQPKTAAIGEAAPDFTLTDLDGETFTLSDHRGKIVVLEWFNPDCPYVVKHHEVHKTMQNLYERYKEHGVVWVAINSGAPGKQGAGQERNERAYSDFQMVYPLLLDGSGDVGRAYNARRTPEMYIIDREGILRYQGAIDSDRHPTRLGETNYVDQALGEIVRGESVTTPETRAYGCTVKY